MIEGVLYIESQGNVKGAVKKALEDTVEKLKNEDGVTVDKTVFEEVIKDGNNFSSSAEVDVRFGGLREYFMASMRYAPYAIILESPKRLEIASQEFLTVLAEITAFTKRFLAKQGISANISDEKEDETVVLPDKNGRFDDGEIDALLDQRALRVKIVIEMDCGEDEAIRRTLQMLGKDVFIHKIKVSHLEERILVAVHAFMYEPKTLVNLCIRLTPVLIEILEPEQIVITTLGLQDAGVELAATYFELAHLHHLRGSRS